MRTHEASGESRVSADLAVNLDKTLGEDLNRLTAVQGVLQTVAEEDDQRQRLAELVGTSRRPGRLRTATSTMVERGECHGSATVAITGAQAIPSQNRGATRTHLPVSLSSIQCLGAAKRFKCFLGPLACTIQ
jgi:hypothetical protein